MESTRERKDREFRRLQKNLMQLLLEQKKELDDLREKGRSCPPNLCRIIVSIIEYKENLTTVASKIMLQMKYIHWICEWYCLGIELETATATTAAAAIATAQKAKEHEKVG